MIFHVYKFATSSDVQINSIKKNGKVHRRRAFLFFVFLRTMFVRHRWFLREAKIDTQGTTFRSPTLFFILPLQFTCLTTERYRCESSRWVYSLLNVLFQIIARVYLSSYILFFIANIARSFLERKERKQTIIYYYPWRFAEPADFPSGKRICLCSRFVQLIPLTASSPVLLKINQLAVRDFHALF